MLERMIIRLTEPICVHTTGPNVRDWDWRIRIGNGRKLELVIRCQQCSAELIVPAPEVRAILRVAKRDAVTLPNEERERAPDTPGEPIPYAHVFTKFDETFLKKCKISTAGYTIAP